MMNGMLSFTIHHTTQGGTRHYSISRYDLYCIEFTEQHILVIPKFPDPNHGNGLQIDNKYADCVLDFFHTGTDTFIREETDSWW